VSGRLCDFSLERQIEIVAEGKNLIRDWTGKAPVAFRAGAYSANLDTITALEQNQFTVDSSYFAFHANCGLSQQLKNESINKPFYIGNILEVPITCYWLARGIGYQKLSKLDINACSSAEMSDIVPKLVRAKMEYVILFLHSFSFIRWKRNFTGVVPNHRAMERFEVLLQSISKAGYGTRFSTMAEVAAGTIKEQPDRTDFVPSLRTSNILPRAFLRLVESNR